MMSPALQRVGSVLLFAVLPAVIVVAMFAVAHDSGSLSVDFHNELYPEAEKLLDWENPFPGPDAELWRGHNLIWPPVAALLVAPFTVLSPDAADWAVALVGLACFMASLRIVGVRDWRVYGAFVMWPSVIGEIRVSHLTPFLCVLAALAWRYRDAKVAPGVAVGLAAAIKFLLWPLGVWLAARGRWTAAATAAIIAGSSVLLVLPFTGLDEYLRTLLELGRIFDQESYSPFGFLMQIGAPQPFARGAMFVLGALLLAGCWRRGSFGLAVAAALVLSPIVWLDYYAVAAVPLAAVRPRLSLVWLAPLATWGLLSAGLGTGNGWGSARVLVVFTIVFAVIVRAERQAEAGGEGHHRAATLGPAPSRRIDPKPSSG
jgi:Glycosyltransferase family 87